MTIAQFAHRLTRPHLSFMPDGKAGEVPSLITELREAVNHSASGGNGSDGQPLPFNTAALELLKFFERDAGEHHRHRYGTIYRGQLENLIQKIADDTDHPITAEGNWEQFFEHWMSDWCDLIDDMIRPTKTRALDGTPCPSCGQATHGKERETCIIIHCYIPGQGRDLKPIEAWTATCRGCDATWANEDMAWLVASLAA